MTFEADILEDEEVISNSNDLDLIEYFGEKPLRWYQVAVRNQLAQELEMGVKRICIVMPTGAGKTITIACSLSDSRVRAALGVTSNRKLRVLFAAHKHRLLTQAEKVFADSNNVEIIPQSIFSPLPEDLEWDVCVNDEFHHESCATFQYHLEKLGNRPILGMTATDDRADSCILKFETKIEPISREQAVAEGFLAETYLNSIMDSPHQDKVPVTKTFLDQYLEEFGQTMMFFRTKKEVREIADYLQSKGKKVVAILAQNEKSLDEILNQFSAGEIQFVVNCNKINEGVDCKGVTDCYLGRAYGSYPQLNQVIGRAARPDSDCRIWELVNPLSGRNLDTTVVVGTPKRHRLISRRKGNWVEQDFDYVSNRNEIGGPRRNYG
jgi:superfamily II DNA or RNA helicase